MPDKNKVLKFTICLLKPEIASFEDALDPEIQTESYPLNDLIPIEGALFLGGQKQSAPDWATLLSPYLQRNIRNVYTAGVSAVLLIKYQSRIFSVCFGRGKSLLAASSWVRDFGLKVAVNRVDPAKLRTFDTKTYDELVVSARKQTSRSSSVNSFQLDVARDLVRGVMGDSRDTTFFKRLHGADSITFTTEVPIEDFGDILDELLEAYKDTAYKANFDWIDNIKEVDFVQKQQLDAALIAAIRANDIAEMHLAPTDVVSWEEIKGFNYPCGTRAVTYPELELEDYLTQIGDRKDELSIETLKRHKIRVYYERSAGYDEPWSIYDCLVWDVSLDEGKYALFDGRWFEIDRGYSARVETYVNGIVSEQIVFPEAVSGNGEDKYNEIVASDQSRYVLLDKCLIRPSHAATPIEFCDLLSVNGQFIHVKKRSSSATLSHLFSQGSVASDAFLQDQITRGRVREMLTEKKADSFLSLITEERPDPAKYEVVYGVIAKVGAKWPPKLPFFSMVNLMHHAGRIRGLGFKVSLHHIRQI